MQAFPASVSATPGASSESSLSPPIWPTVSRKKGGMEIEWEGVEPGLEEEYMPLATGYVASLTSGV